MGVGVEVLLGQGGTGLDMQGCAGGGVGEGFGGGGGRGLVGVEVLLGTGRHRT